MVMVRCSFSWRMPVVLALIASASACQTPPREPKAASAESTPRWDAPGVAGEADSATRSGVAALADLRDFQPVPNPEILGYVYPHLSGDLPVPGYYTVFRLRARDHYAELGEGQYDEGPLP